MSLELITSLESEIKDLNDLSNAELKQVLNTALNSRNFDLLAELNQSILTSYNEPSEPDWLKSDFKDTYWEMEFTDAGNKVKFSINFEIKFGNANSLLTSAENHNLLSGFKFWILSCLHPRVINTSLFAAKTQHRYVRALAIFLDYLLINADRIQLSSLGINAINEDIVKSYLKTLSTGGVNAIYKFNTHLQKLAIRAEKEISEKDLAEFQLNFPDINLIPKPFNKAYNISENQQKSLVVFSYKNGLYDRYKANINRNKLRDYIFGSNLLFCNVQLKIPEELGVFDTSFNGREYQLLPNISGSNSIQEILIALKSIKSVTLLQELDDAPNINITSFKTLTSKSIERPLAKQNIGRFITLPPQLVFDCIKNGFEYSIKNFNHLLESVYQMLKHKPTEHVIVGVYENKKQTSTTELYIYKQNLPEHVLADQTIKMGVVKSNVNIAESNYPEQLRQNLGLLECYSVLLGSIKVLIGALMARRSSELINLLPYGNLYPNKDPNKHLNTHFYLWFDNRKSGISGKVATRDRIKRPIPHKLAKFIWTLEQFNKKVIKLELENSGIDKTKSIGLFNNFDRKTFKLNINSLPNYNRDLDLFCDYFETPVMFYEGEECRYYIRQHQLRRFFALIFFWSKSFDGLDTLREFLGHTDIRHLYNYITESIPGEVMNGVKATVLVSKHAQKTVENYSALIALLKKEYGADDAEILLHGEAYEDYETASQTIPEMSKIGDESLNEKRVLDLLNNKLISLEPEFFTITNSNGTVTEDFTLVLRVLDN